MNTMLKHSEPRLLRLRSRYAVRWHLKTLEKAKKNMTDKNLRLLNPPQAPFSTHVKTDHILTHGRQRVGPQSTDE